jgi:hypothetical protein
VWESTLAQATFLRSLFYLGDIPEICRRVPELVENANARGDLFSASVLMVTGGYLYYLAIDRPDYARQHIETNLRDWEAHGFHSRMQTARLGLVETALYVNDCETAWKLAHQRQTMLLRIAQRRATTFFVYLLSQRGRSALACAVAQPERRDEFLRASLSNAKTIARCRLPYAQPLAGLLMAGAASVQDDRAEAVRLFSQCEGEFERCGMAMHAAVCRLRRGQISGGESGRELVLSTERTLASLQIANPARIAGMLAPGRWNEAV